MSMFQSEYEYPSNEFDTASEWETGGLGDEAEVYELEESTELELASELLEITSEEELEEFLGKLVKSVARGARTFIRSPIGKALGGVLKNVAKTALPVVGSAIGSFVAPGVGTAIGGKLGSLASSLLEVEEYESMDEAEAELEAARRYVRWASGTVRNAMRAPTGVPPRTVVRSAAVSSARRYAPALLRSQGQQGRATTAGRSAGGWGSDAWSEPTASSSGGPTRCTCGAGRSGGSYGQSEPSSQPRTGQWSRRGNTLVVHGV